MRGRALGGMLEGECSRMNCIRMTGGGRRWQLGRQGVRGISWWLCIRRGSDGG